MKRKICLLFSIVLTLSLCITASAAGSSTLNGNTSVTVGSNIEFIVNVSGCSDATSIAVAVSYDGGFELVSGTWLKSGSITKFDTATNKGALGGLASPDVNGNLFKLVLKAKTASANAQSVSVNVIAKNGSTEIMNVTPSKSVKLKEDETLIGDANDDGKINLDDVVILAQYVAEWDIECNEAALDVNGDGVVNLDDIVHLAQYVAEWEGIVLG